MNVAQSCPTLWPHRLYSPWNSPGQNTGVDSLSLLQGIFPTQGSNPGLPHCRQILASWAKQFPFWETPGFLCLCPHPSPHLPPPPSPHRADLHRTGFPLQRVVGAAGTRASRNVFCLGSEAGCIPAILSPLLRQDQHSSLDTPLKTRSAPSGHQLHLDCLPGNPTRQPSEGKQQQKTYIYIYIYIYFTFSCSSPTHLYTDTQALSESWLLWITLPRTWGHR